jgi:hypothetical protein
MDRLGHYTTRQKVGGSISNEVIGFFNLLNPFSRTMTLGLTQPLTKINTRNLLGEVGCWPALRDNTLTTVSELIV